MPQISVRVFERQPLRVHGVLWLEYRFTTPGFSCGTIPAPALYGVFGRHSRRNQLGMSVETDKGIGWLLDKSKSATLKGRFSRRRCSSDASGGVEAKLSRGRGTFARVLTSRSILLESDVLLVIQTDARTHSRLCLDYDRSLPLPHF